MGNPSPENLECNPRGIIAEYNVCKTMRQEVYDAFYDIKCKNCSNV